MTTSATPAPVGPAPVPPAPAAPGRRRPSPTGRVLTVVGGVLAGLVVLQVGTQLLAEASATTSTATERLTAAPVVELVSDGDVTVVATAGDDVAVERETRAAWQTPQSSSERTGDRLVVVHRCGWRIIGTCRTDLTVELPRDTMLVVRTSDGHVRAEGALADATVRTSSGDVAVTGARGDVTARTSDGSVSVTDVTGAVEARTSSGHIQVADADGDVTARTSDGDVVVRRAGGGVEARTSSGHVEVDEAGGATWARTSDGDVTIAAVDGDVTALSSSGHVTVRGTGVPVALDMSTSSGRQTVDAPTDPAASRHVTIRTSDGDVSYLGPR